ncbi:KOW domain-containing RNA-binding protein [Clostridium felsineum]|uniref:Uncharacterized protein n=1 Tax=Clostridium felsineum TaxID=36839 RepID=A0A1S8KXY6_9CLOT|nr:KOW domain-containing RNA-binding protein [Clostridium felsineum]MCR3757994.1 KOW domain-containing RNA-binding protein [Clostridium felsineum]URZ08191.1 hypothetical protein CLROS_035570 [Clostridium felsineum]URZ13222.1 hypothetical protein CROST_039720 [Clostridium felsineum]URZ14797.1 hypothetical protein CLFE_008100 [Clostridium felsineum DSM 794]
MNENYLGKVVCSKAGRDKDGCFIIVRVIDDKYVYISDGDLRKVEKPKRKKLKHLSITDMVCEDVRDKLKSNYPISNSAIRKFLESVCTSKEV